MSVISYGAITSCSHIATLAAMLSTRCNARAKVGLDDIHFHDTRREALSRLAKKLDVLTLAKLSGHRDTRILLNVYYQVKADDVADMLG